MTDATIKKMNFTFKMDRDLRDQFGQVCDELGISMSTALTAFVKQTVRQQRVSFSLVDENGFTPQDASELKRRLTELQAGAVKSEQHHLIEA